MKNYLLANFRLHHFKSLGYRKLEKIRKSRQICRLFEQKNLKNCFLYKFLGKITRAGNLLFRSFGSNQMSNCEQFAQITRDKWATVSESLRSLMINEQMSDSLKIFWLKSYFYNVLYTYFYFKKWAIHSFALFYERCKPMAQVAHQK